MTTDAPRATGWKPDSHDRDDKLLADLYGLQDTSVQDVYDVIVDKATKRTKFTLEGSCPPVYDQFDLGSCVANATAAALRFAWQNCFLNYGKPYSDFEPSRLWIYYYARQAGDPKQDLRFRDTGCQIRDALKVLKNKGVCREDAWPYLNEVESQAVAAIQKAQEDPDAMPGDCRAGILPDQADDESVKNFFDFGFDYHRIRSLTDVKDKASEADTVVSQMCACLSEGFPIIFGFAMYKEADGRTSEFFDDKNWSGDVFNVQIDKLENRGLDDGGHAVLCVGFDRDRKLFRVMNSWNNTWKDKGFFWMPFSWFENAGRILAQGKGKPSNRLIRPAYDLWTIRPHLAPLLRDHDPVE